MRLQSLDCEGPLEGGMATHSSILAQGQRSLAGYSSVWSWRVRHDWSDLAHNMHQPPNLRNLRNQEGWGGNTQGTLEGWEVPGKAWKIKEKAVRNLEMWEMCAAVRCGAVWTLSLHFTAAMPGGFALTHPLPRSWYSHWLAVFVAETAELPSKQTSVLFLIS